MAESSDDSTPPTQPVDDRILKDVVAYVEVRSGRDNRSKAVCWVLEQLGAVVAKSFTDEVTHVIFKEGSKRTKNRAQKKKLHLVSVLWVDSCKQKQQHVSERLFPASIPDEKSTPGYIKALKKSKSMQPNDFEEDLANSAERCNRKKRRLDLLGQYRGTPTGSPRSFPVLAEDTQPRSPMGMFTPVRLNIPETPPSMKAKLEEIQKRLESGTECSDIGSDKNEEPLAAVAGEMPLQRRLFGASGTRDPSVEKELTTDTNHETETEVQTIKTTKKSKSSSLSPNRNILKKKGRHSTPVGCSEDKPIKNENIQTKTVNSPLLSSRNKQNTASHPKSVSIETSPAVEKSVIKRTSGRRKSLAVHVQDKEPQKETRRSRRMTIAVNTSVHFGENTVIPPPVSGCVDRPECDTNLEVGSNHVNDKKSEPLDKDLSKVTRYRRKSVAVTGRKSTPSSEVLVKETVKRVLKKNLSDSNLKTTEPENLTSSLDSKNSCMKPTDERGILKTNSQNVMKKKLLSLTDLNEPFRTQSLVEPSRCSTKERPTLDDSKLGNRKTSVEKSQRGGKRKRRSDKDDENLPSSKQFHGRKASSHDTDEMKSILASDTFSFNDDDDIGTINTPKMSDEKDDVHSLSMSTVYDPSFLNSRVIQPPRESIAEFKASKLSGSRGDKKSAVRNDTSRNVKTSSVSSRKKRLAGPTNDTSTSSESDRDTRRRSGTRMESLLCSRRPSLVMTSLHTQEQELVISVVRKLGRFTITDMVCDHTTHLICGEARRTLNILYGLARGCWFVSKEWVLQSLEVGYWLDESPYEVLDMFPSAKVRRELKAKGGNSFKPDIFSSLGHMFISPKVAPPRDHLCSLVKLCHGQVTQSLNRAEVYIGAEFHPDKMSVSPAWVLDCITEQKLLSMDNYKLGRPKRESSPEF